MAGKQQELANASGWQARVKRARRAFRKHLNRLLTRLLGTTAPRRGALDADTRRILVVRINKRLGNILFLTPMLRTLAAALPAARIDVVIQDARHRPLLEGLPGVDRVWVQRKSLPAMIGLARRLRAQRYDLAIDPSGNSTGNRLAVALSGARQRMGFAAADQWLRLSHAAPRPVSRHQAEQAIELLTGTVDGLIFERFDTLAVCPGERARAAAGEHWRQALGQQTSAPVIGFFIHATGRKRLPADWWQDWCTAVREHAPDAVLLELRAPDVPDPLMSGMASVSIAELDVLAALLARLQVFVAADSGPMHLAAAAGVPVVGLFRATDPTAYAPLGPGCVSLSGDRLTSHAAASAAARVVAARQRPETG